MTADFLRKTLLGLNIGYANVRYYVLVVLAIVIWLSTELLSDQETLTGFPTDKEIV